MGKTLPPFSPLIEHVQAGVMVSRAWPFETIVMTVLLEHEKRIERLVHELCDLKPEASKLLIFQSALGMLINIAFNVFNG